MSSGKLANLWEHRALAVVHIEAAANALPLPLHFPLPLSLSPLAMKTKAGAGARASVGAGHLLLCLCGLTLLNQGVSDPFNYIHSMCGYRGEVGHSQGQQIEPSHV